MQALFIGHAYIDVTFLTGHVPEGDEKTIADDYAISFGGNAVTAAFCCAKLGIAPDLLCTAADDWLAIMFRDMARAHSVTVHERKVAESSLSFIMPNDGKRAIVRCRDDHYLHPFPTLNLDGCKVLHIDGHQPDAALHYVKRCRELGILTSLDGGGVRSNTDEVLQYIDIAIASVRFCEQLGLSVPETLQYLKSNGCRIGGVTRGEFGMDWYDEPGQIRNLPAFPVPLPRIRDTNGAGDVFHGAYVYSYLNAPEKPWGEHFDFARAASAHAIQHLGNEASLPGLEDVAAVREEFLAEAS